MTTRERTIIYTLLAVLAAFNLFHLVGGAQEPAYADSQRTFDTLGPADAVALRPSGEDAGDANAIDIVNHGSRIAWGDSAHTRVYSVGFVHVGKPMSGLMSGGAYQERRQDLADELDEMNAEKREALIALMEELRGMGQEDPAFQEKLTEAQSLDAEYQQWLADARSRTEALEAELIAEAYAELMAAVDVVSEQKGVDLVYRFIPDDEEFAPRDRSEAQAYIRGRTMLEYPEGLDLTDAVMQELALEIN